MVQDLEVEYLVSLETSGFSQQRYVRTQIKILDVTYVRTPKFVFWHYTGGKVNRFIVIRG